MAKQTTDTAKAQNSGVKFKKPEGSENLTPLTFINASALNKAGTTGVIAEGVLIGTMDNKYKPGKPSFKIEQSDGNVLVVDSAGNLGYRMKSIKQGQLVQITYNGMKEIKSGDMAGKLSHNFDVLVAE